MLLKDGREDDLCLVAVGGYGRGELAPHSDIDLLVLWVGRPDDAVTKAALRDLLYPLWDAGFTVGHAVTSPKGALERCKGDHHAATSLLSARRVAGSEQAFEELVDRRARWIQKERRAVARQITEGVLERRARRSYAGWTLAPDIKEDVGGLRDLHALGWFAALSDEMPVPEPARRAGEVLISVREALHLEVPRRTDTMRIDLQAKVARRMSLGDEGADVLMEKVHSAAREIEWTTGRSVRRVVGALDRGPARSGSSTTLATGIFLQDGEVTVDLLLPQDCTQGFALLAAVASCGKPLADSAVDWLKEALASVAWTAAARDNFSLILRGEHAEQTLRLMDHLDLWPAALPEWSQIHGRAQYDLYHRYTVDGHLFKTVDVLSDCLDDPLARIAADELQASGQSLAPLYLAALLHDIGKGSGTDHSEAGEEIARRAMIRMGFDDLVIDQVSSLVRHHLLLSDTATRRDIDDGQVIESVARKLRTTAALRMLLILSQADGRATGPEAWTTWKASLVGELYRRVLHALETGRLPERSDVNSRLQELERYDPVLSAATGDLLQTLPPSYVSSTEVEIMAEELKMLAAGDNAVRCRIDPDPVSGQASITLALTNRPGTLARAAGVLTLHRMSVLRAQAYVSSAGKALQRFVVKTPPDPNWGKLDADLESVYSSRLALEPRLERKIRDYGGGGLTTVEIRTLPEEALHSTVIEVRARDAIGLLYAITRAVEDLDLDIHVAKIDTLGDRVVDVFYVRTLTGGKLDELQSREVEISIQHRVDRLLG